MQRITSKDNEFIKHIKKLKDKKYRDEAGEYIIEGIKLAKENGLTIPIVYNTSSYENIETIKMLDGIIDIYLPDLKL